MVKGDLLLEFHISHSTKKRKEEKKCSQHQLTQWLLKGFILVYVRKLCWPIMNSEVKYTIKEVHKTLVNMGIRIKIINLLWLQLVREFKGIGEIKWTCMYLWNQFLLRITGYAKLDSKVPSGRPQGTLFHTLKYNFIGPMITLQAQKKGTNS